MKTYYDFMSEIKADELYDRLISYGMFSEKLPPIFTGDLFLKYCKNIRTQTFSDEWRGYINYESMRNTNIPRNIGIPTPMGHELLCKALMKYWTELTEYFGTKTKEQSRIISRIHIRKMQDTKALFLMNYKNWIDDGTPEPDIYLGKEYMIHADISKCYPSIYTHAIPWALVGKDVAKKNIKRHKEWYNQIDYFAQISKNGETHGLLIGPHTSNILSEIILCAIDEDLSKKYDSYIRNI
ncbi:MAG: RNA-directed DNA polymerase, partial [Fusobacterium necrophorum]|nr:RNA-directed DNA polymerase [Fusobacterium necrophorum]